MTFDPHIYVVMSSIYDLGSPGGEHAGHRAV